MWNLNLYQWTFTLSHIKICYRALWIDLLLMNDFISHIGRLGNISFRNYADFLNVGTFHFTVLKSHVWYYNKFHLIAPWYFKTFLTQSWGNTFSKILICLKAQILSLATNTLKGQFSLKRQFNLFIFKNLSSIQFSCSVVSNPLWPHESQHARPPCPSQTPGVYSNTCPSSQWCHPAISSSVVPFSSCPQSLPASGSFPVSQLFAWGGQSIGVSASASVLPMNTQDWSALGWTGWISLQSQGLSRVFSNTTVQKHQFFSAQLSSQSNSHIHTWPLEKP